MMRRGEKNMQKILKWLFPSASSEDMESARNRVLNRLRGEFPERIEAFRFRPDSGTKAESLRQIDQLVLTAVYLLGSDGCTWSIAQKVEELSSEPPNLGTIYVSLDRLRDRGLISAERRQDCDRHWRRFYKLTERGKDVLARSAPAQQAIEKLGHFA